MGKAKAEISEKSLDEARGFVASAAKPGSIPVGEARKLLQTAAYFDLLVARSEKSLRRFLDKIREIETGVLPDLDGSDPNKLLLALELKNMLTLGRMEALVCLERKESRGPHYREDYPEQNDGAWVKNVRIRKAAASASGYLLLRRAVGQRRRSKAGLLGLMNTGCPVAVSRPEGTQRRKSMESCRRYSCDVLVIGGGGAAVTAAVTASGCGADVLLVSKGLSATGIPGSPWA
jgi:succinate dehydrogenase/fumarate reductase flavoprotein subunit